MTPAARIYCLTRDDHDMPEWGEPICIFDGHWNPYAAIRHFLEDGDDHPEGTYKCESSGGTATIGWNGDTIDLAA